MINTIIKVLLLPYKAVKVLLLEGPIALFKKIGYFFIDIESFLNDCNKNNQVYYRNFDEYLNYSTLVPEINIPFSEEGLRIIGYMDLLKKHKKLQYKELPQDELVSIIMPTYNRADTITDAIGSVLTQSYNTWELIIVDDGSQDSTSSVVNNFEDKRIIFKRFKENRGPAFARNRALETARGSYICYLDSDNTMDQDFILIMLHELLNNPDFDTAYCAQRLFHNLNTSKQELFSVRFGPFNRSMLENRNYIDMGTLIHQHNVVKQYGYFNEDMRRLVDWEFIVKITGKNFPKAVPCILSNYNYARSNDQVTFNKSYKKAIHLFNKSLYKEPIRRSLPRAPIQEVNDMFSLATIPQVKKRKSVSIIIPNYECFQYLKLCINSVEAFTKEYFYELIVVDNASGNDTASYLEELTKLKRAKVIKNERNYGFTNAVNQGIEAAASSNDIILLNNDAVVTSNWLEGLQEVFDYVKDVGIIAPRQTLLPYTKTMKIHSPEVIIEREADVNLSQHHENIINPLLYEPFGLMELNFVPFFCVYIPRKTINKIGLLDHINAPHYRSDRLYCEAVRHIANTKVVYTPRSKVYHLLQKSTEVLKNKDQKLYLNMFADISQAKK